MCKLIFIRLGFVLGKGVQEMAMRKNFLIMPKFQLTLVAANLFISLSCFLFVAFENHLAFNVLRNLAIQKNLSPSHPYFKFLSLQAYTLNSHLLGAFFFSILLSMIGTIYLSHKLAGPLVRLKRYFSDLEAGTSGIENELRFRKGDYIADLAPTINKVLRGLSQKSQGASESPKSNGRNAA